MDPTAFSAGTPLDSRRLAGPRAAYHRPGRNGNEPPLQPGPKDGERSARFLASDTSATRCEVPGEQGDPGPTGRRPMVGGSALSIPNSMPVGPASLYGAERRHKESNPMKIPLIVTLAVTLAPASAIARQGTLRGTVTSATGAVIPGTSVEACGPAPGGGCRSAVTDQSGHYSFGDLVPGAYRVSIRRDGYKSFVQEEVEVAEQDARYLHAALTIGEIRITYPRPPRGRRNVPGQDHLLKRNRTETGVLGPRAGIWTLNGSAGSTLSIVAASAAFDVEVELLSPAGDLLARDRGRDSDAWLVATLPSAGRHHVKVRAADGGMGPYELAVHAAKSWHLELGTPVDAALDAELPVEVWEFEGAAGQIVSVRAGSAAFDPRVDLVSANGQRLARDGTGGRGDDAWLVATLPSAGRYQVVARSAHGRGGPYRLAVHAAKSSHLELGTPVDVALGADAPVEIWEFEGAAGQIVSVRAGSAAFHSELDLLSPSGDLLAREGGHGDDTWLVATLP